VDFAAPLQCTSCKSREVVDQSEVEADVYALADFILRLCSTCGTSTQWRHAEDDVSVPAEPATLNLESTNGLSAAVYPPALTGSGATVPGSAQHLQLAGNEVADLDAPFEPLPMAATAVAARKANRRDVRSRVSFTACVVQDGVEEIVECGNVSKGSFSFRSRKAYLARSDIDVALPYYPGHAARIRPRHHPPCIGVAEQQFPLWRHVRRYQPNPSILIT